MCVKFEKNLDIFKEKIYGVNFDISKYFLPDNEIAKKILLFKNKQMTKDEVDLIIDGQVVGASSSSVYPLDRKSNIYDEVKKLKDEVRVAAMMLIKEQKSIVKDLVNSTLLIGSSIPGITLTIGAIPFNIPSAISSVCLIIDQLSKLIDRISDTIKYLDPLKYLKFLIDSQKCETITAPLNASVLALIALLNPINAIKDFLSRIQDTISNLIKPENLLKQIKQLKKEIKRKNKDLNNTNDDTEKEEIREDIVDLEQRLKDLQNGYSISFDEREVSQGIEQSINEIKQISENLTYIYDVELSDGTILTNITQSELESIKNKYKIVKFVEE